MTHLLWVLFAWPNGICTGNMLASIFWIPFDLWIAWLLRHQLMKRFVKLHHHHKKLHEESLRAAQEAENDRPGKV